MKYFGLIGGYIVGMTLQAIILPFFKKGLIDGRWFLFQLIGLFIMACIWVYLDRKVIIPWIKSINWKAIDNSIDNWILKTKEWLTK
jgi:hypothetical protein